MQIANQPTDEPKPKRMKRKEKRGKHKKKKHLSYTSAKGHKPRSIYKLVHIHSREGSVMYTKYRITL